MKASVTLGRPFGITVGAHWSLFAFGLLAAWSLASGFEAGLPGYGTGHLLGGRRRGRRAVLRRADHPRAGPRPRRAPPRPRGRDHHALDPRRHGHAVEGPRLGQGRAADRGRRPAGQLRRRAADVRWRRRRGGPDGCTRPDLRARVAGASPPPCWPSSTCCRPARWTAAASSPPSSGCARRTRRGRRWPPPRCRRSSAGCWSAPACWLLFAFGAFSGVWFALIGWIVIAASTADRRLALWRTALRGLRFRDVMGPPPPSIPAAMTVRDLVLGAGRRGARAAARRQGRRRRRRRRAVDLRRQPGRLHPSGHPGRRSGQAARRLRGRRAPTTTSARPSAVASLRLPVLVQAGDGSVVGQVAPTSCRAGPPTTT